MPPRCAAGSVRMQRTPAGAGCEDPRARPGIPPEHVLRSGHRGRASTSRCRKCRGQLAGPCSPQPGIDPTHQHHIASPIVEEVDATPNRWQIAYEVLMGLLALATVATLFTDAPWASVVNWTIYVMFAADVVVRFMRSDDRRGFPRRNWYDLVALIPFELARPFRTIRLLRFVRVFRAFRLMNRVATPGELARADRGGAAQTRSDHRRASRRVAPPMGPGAAAGRRQTVRGFRLGCSSRGA